MKHQQQILTKPWKPCAQSMNKNLTLWPNHLPNLHQNVVNMFLIVNRATVTIPTIFELSSSHARATPIKFTKQEWVSEWVSQLGSESVSDKHSQWSDSGPIKIDTKYHSDCSVTFVQLCYSQFTRLGCMEFRPQKSGAKTMYNLEFLSHNLRSIKLTSDKDGSIVGRGFGVIGC